MNSEYGGRDLMTDTLVSPMPIIIVSNLEVPMSEARSNLILQTVETAVSKLAEDRPRPRAASRRIVNQKSQQGGGGGGGKGGRGRKAAPSEKQTHLPNLNTGGRERFTH